MPNIYSEFKLSNHIFYLSNNLEKLQLILANLFFSCSAAHAKCSLWPMASGNDMQPSRIITTSSCTLGFSSFLIVSSLKTSCCYISSSSVNSSGSAPAKTLKLIILNNRNKYKLNDLHILFVTTLKFLLRNYVDKSSL